MNDGYIKLSRNVFEHWLWTDENEPFTRRSAWIDLVQMARWKNKIGKRVIAGSLVRWHRGQLVASERFLSQRWRWNTSKVRRFIKLLVSDDMVTTDTGQGVTIITIVNYEIYNNSEEKPEMKHVNNYQPVSYRQQRSTDEALTKQQRSTDEALTKQQRSTDEALTKQQRSTDEALTKQNSKKGKKREESNKVKKGNNNKNTARDEKLLLTPQIDIDNFYEHALTDVPFKKSSAKKSFPNREDVETVIVGALATFRSYQIENHGGTEKPLKEWQIHFKNWLPNYAKKINHESRKNNPRPNDPREIGFTDYQKYY